MQARQRGPEPLDDAMHGAAAKAASMQRLQRSADRIARLEQLRSGFQESIIRRESRRAAAEISAYDSRLEAEATSDAREDEEVEAWIYDEAVSMLRAGWSREELAEFGFSPEIIAKAIHLHAGG